MLVNRPLEELKNALMKKEKTEIDLMKLKIILKENQFLKQIPPSLRSEFCKVMSLNFCSKGSHFLTEIDKKVDFFILIEGSLKIRQKMRKEILVQNLEIFGYSKRLTGQPWVAGNVVAVEDSYIVSIPRKTFKKLVKEAFSLIENNKLLEFLVKSVPGVRQIGQAGKEKILTYFRKVFFKPNDFILSEGQICESAYIIEEGECKLMSSKNPIRKGSPLYQGLVSKTTSCFNIGLATVGEWIGDDSLIRSQPMDFSVIAVSNVVLLKIDGEDFFEGLSRETQAILKESMESKIRWRRERKKKIIQVISKEVAGSNEHDLNELKNNEKFYPIANKSTVRLITKREKAKQGKTDSPDIRDTEIRPKTGFSVGHKKVKSAEEQKIKLYSAGTIGYNMIPFVAIKTIKKKQIKKPKSISTREDRVFASFGEKVRYGRPASPNPAEVWARNHNVRLIN